MLTTMDRYITGHAFRAIVVVLGSLLALLTLFALFEELNEDETTYGLQEAILYVLRTMPRRLDEILVYGLFLGYLIALGRLAETNELTIFRVTGMSPPRLVLALVPSLLVWLIVSIAMSEFVAPVSERAAEAAKEEAEMQHHLQQTEKINRVALWIRTDNMFMQVREIDADGAIFGVKQYWLNENNELIETVQAERGQYDERAEQWNLLNGSSARLTTTNATAETFHARTWDNNITPAVLASQVFLDAKKMSLMDLRRQIEFGKTLQRGTSDYEIAFWSRILRPLTYLGLTILALGIVMGPLREVGVGLRLTVGIFAGLGFKYLQDLFAPAAIVFNIPAPLAVMIPIATYWLVAIYLVKRNA